MNQQGTSYAGLMHKLYKQYSRAKQNKIVKNLKQSLVKQNWYDANLDQARKLIAWYNLQYS